MNKVVVYTDGGANPNPGLSGWGSHGYIYEDGKAKKKYLTNASLTPTGYTNNNVENVDVVKFFEFMGTNGINTNNASEINSLYFTLLKLIEEEEFDHIHILVDSEYVRKGVTEWSSKWIKNNWFREDGNPVSNQKEWKRLLEVIDHYKEKNISYEIEWVKGHSGDIGNQIADTLCTIAINMMRNGIKDEQRYLYFEPYLYWDIKPERHPYLAFKRLYFNTISKNSDIGYYFLEDSKKEEKYIGKKDNETAYSVIKLNTPDRLIEIVKEKQTKIAEDLNVVALLKLDRLYSPEVYRYIETYGIHSLFRANNYSVNINFLDNKPITLELDPPGLSLYAMQTFGHMEEVLKEIMDSTDTYFTLDITDHFFSKETKGKKEITVLNPNIKQTTKIVDIPLAYDYKKFNIGLVLGTDLLPRSNLKRIENLNPKLKLVIIKETYCSFSYMTYIESDLGSGMWSNYHTNSVYY